MAVRFACSGVNYRVVMRTHYFLSVRVVSAAAYHDLFT